MYYGDTDDRLLWPSRYTALIDHLYDQNKYDFTLLNRSDRPDNHEYGSYETGVADIADYEPVRDSADG